MRCKLCNKNITLDCMLISKECVFCAYKTDEWDSNGELITKAESMKEAGKHIGEIK